MTLSPGTRLGPYQVLAPLGKGGMGEVYSARDTRLDRTVAIKVLQQHLSADPDGRARFEREARAVSSLNHPHICVLHDIGRHEETDFLVLEHLEGESLEERLERGPLPAPELLRLALQIADALDKAHRQGIVHRDLKPGNIMLTPAGAKLLDFGLARSMGTASPMAGLTMAQTLTRPITAEGTLVGTFQYMAPELLEGREADARSDIFAFGAVLYEMATGKRAFAGKSHASVIASILEKDPEPMGQFPPLTPPALERLVTSCLAKDPEERRHSAHDIRLELKAIAEAPAAPSAAVAPVATKRRGGMRRVLPPAVVALAAVAAFVAGWIAHREPGASMIRFSFAAPEGIVTMGDPRISPDGSMIAFNATDSTGVNRIWIRSLDALHARSLAGTEGAMRPFWSPDSRYIAFMMDGKLRKMLATGGPAQTLAETGSRGDGTWSPEGVILFDGSAHDSVRMVPAGGGVPAGLLPLDREHGETGSAWPQFLPDGKRFLFLGLTNKPEETLLKLGNLDGSGAKTVATGNFSRIEYSPAGYVLFVRDRALVAQTFDADAGALVGDPFPVVDDVGGQTGGVSNAAFSASANNVLAFRPGSGSVNSRLVWMNRDGTEAGELGTPGDYRTVRISPDGKRVAVTLIPAGGRADVWIIDRARNVGSRLTSDPANDYLPVWSRDGRTIYFTSDRTGTPQVYRIPVSGVGKDTVTSAVDGTVIASDASPDGANLLVVEAAGSTGTDIGTLPLDGGGTVSTLVGREFSERSPRVSPDGRWVVYESDESGEREVYLQPYPAPGNRWRVSSQGGLSPHWRGDGRELFYLSPAGDMMSVDVGAGSDPQLDVPRRLFEATAPLHLPVGDDFDVTADGQRFLVVRPMRERAAVPTTVIVNWTAALKDR
jgi:Tol biopolymer transport system component